MKKLSSLIITALISITFLAGCSESSHPEEGKQFVRLPADLSNYGLAPVTEVFSLTCGHCRKMEQIIPELEKATNQRIGKVHVTFNESAQISAMIYYAAQIQLKATPDHEMMDELFAAVQMGEGATQAERKQAIDNAFESRGLISPYYLGEEMQQALFKQLDLAQDVSVKAKINSVPTFIVSGKYMILTQGHSDVESFARTINYLVEQ
ncbi:thiol:disulfide interchange protein DsbA/DsbL [Vibrio sp. ZSDE26]|uniref:Thiol:disulfide interchange protein DsbA/DsbL n=1 Tax=Vibrio amylolyticus TaxID=2847292 RepID=A0A9X2BHX7_9VIBR|nr:thiol:disulfide interchange protein DsbA/DsbL [Vibrio amylolyticus]MCK6263495.1 thiol:disulfide interchange protein DsbA/DsbL [Vibrio amylolyticus]